MNDGISNAKTHRAHLEPPEASQEKLVGAVASTGAGMSVCNSERPFFSLVIGLPQSHRELPPASGLARDEPLQATKRQLDTTPRTHQLPAAKRARLENTDAQQPRVEYEELEQVAEVCQRFFTQVNQLLMETLVQTTLQQPEPNAPKRPYVLSLEHCVDTADLGLPLESVNKFVSEWLESVELDREDCCRSDTHLNVSDDDPITRQLARSAPEMAYIRDADGFVVPPKPTSTGSRSHREGADTGSVVPSDLTRFPPDSGRSSARSLVEDTFYRDQNLAANRIYMRHSYNPIPEHISNIVEYVGRDRDSPGPSLDEVSQDVDLSNLSMGAGFSGTHLLPYPKSSESLKRSDRQPMSEHSVPTMGSKLKVSPIYSLWV
jgi:hypothetical protein